MTAAPSAQAVRRHPEHTSLKHYDMVERDFGRASRDTGDVPVRVTKMVAAYYYEGLLDKLTAAQQRIAAMRAKLLELAGECAECAGRGTLTGVDPSDGTYHDEPCPDCADIRDAAGGIC